MSFSIVEVPGRYFSLRLFGTVTARDLTEAAVAMWSSEKERPVTLARITDLSDAMEMDIDYKAVWQLAEDRKRRKFPNSFRSAIVAPLPHQLGFARMFQTLNDHEQITVQVFRDMASAEQWIGEKEGKL